MIVPACAWPRSSANNLKPNVFCDCLCLMNIFIPRKFATGIFGSLILVQGHVWDFCPHFSDHPCHLSHIPPPHRGGRVRDLAISGVACVARRFWFCAQSNKGGRGQRKLVRAGARFCDFAAQYCALQNGHATQAISGA